MQDNIGIKVENLIAPYLKKIHADIDNKIIDDEIWKKASQEAQDKEKVKNLYASMKLTEMLLTEHKRLERNLARIRAEQEIELTNIRAEHRVEKNKFLIRKTLSNFLTSLKNLLIGKV